MGLQGSMTRLCITWLVCIAVSVSTHSAFAGKQRKSHYWELGAGAYAPYIYSALEVIPALDLARWDWLVVEVHDERTVEAINKLLRINPRQRYLIRLWPINHLGHSGVFANTATFLCYLYKPGVREEVHRRLRTALRAIKTRMSRPQNVIGFTFLEELPGWWGAGGEISRQRDPNAIPEELKRHRKEIESDLGKPLRWDDEMRLWIGRKYVQTLAEAHRIIKSEFPDKLV
ncbi:MAG TPA: hypothetical protein EYP10_09960, partial [Armatimonadetes bacterium]|nr:hypothetical protein [Armatimonadota bacterium]